MSKELSKFVQTWNDGGYLTRIKTEFADWYGEACAMSFQKQFSPAEYRPLGLSQLGKPAVLSALHTLSKEDPTGEETLKMKWIFHLGDVFEACIQTLLAHEGKRVTSLQDEVEFYGIKGHIDMIVDERLVEVKTMSHSYFNKFVEEQDDDRGYLTQLHLYAYLTNKIDKASWLCLNKMTNELVEIELDYDPSVIRRAKYVAESLKHIKKFEDIQDFFDIPALVVSNTGKLSIPESMKWSGVNNLFYIFKGNYPIRTAW